MIPTSVSSIRDSFLLLQLVLALVPQTYKVPNVGRNKIDKRWSKKEGTYFLISKMKIWLYQSIPLMDPAKS